MSFFEELKRRNVIRVGIAYAVGAWLLLQLTDVLSELLDLPQEVGPVVVTLVLIGFPVILLAAWAFELTPEGLKRESDINRDQPSSHQAGRKLDRLIMVALGVALIYFIYESRFKDAAQPEVVPATPRSDAVASAVTGPEPGESDTKPVTRQASALAVLPFVNMSPSEEQEYFSDGMTEEIINAVVKIPGIAVPARTSVFAYKGRQLDLRQVGQELGVSHILEGSIRSQGKQVRITAQLIEAEDGFHLWSETYDRTLDNIFEVQEEIAAAIASQLVGKLEGSVDPVPNQTRNMAAYDLYLKGRAALRQRSQESVPLLEQAVEADPKFAPAYAALAIALNAQFDDNDRAITLADRALALDPVNVDALNAKAAALRSHMQWAEAEAVFERALAIDPNSAELLEDWAEFLAYTGRMDEALETTRRGVEIDPALAPLWAAHFEALLATGHAEEARNLALDLLEQKGRSDLLTFFVTMQVWLDPRVLELGSATPPLDRLPEETADTWARPLSLVDQFIRGWPESAFEADELAYLKSLYGPQIVQQGLVVRTLARSLLILAGETDHVMETDLWLLGSQELPIHENQELPIHENQWLPTRAGLRTHADFGRYLERAGLVAYWDTAGWPPLCRRSDAAVRCR